MPYIVWSHRCKKCKGQFYFEENEDGNYLVCIQCGYTEKIIDDKLATLLSTLKSNPHEKPVKSRDLSRV